MHYLIKRFPIDFDAIAKESGCTRGRICKTVFGWGVQGGNGDADFCCITPPKTTAGETLKIEEGRYWAVYSDSFWITDRLPKPEEAEFYVIGNQYAVPSERFDGWTYESLWFIERNNLPWQTISIVHALECMGLEIPKIQTLNKDEN